MLPLCDKYFPEIFPSFFGSYHVWRFLTEGRVEWEILADFYEETNLEDFYHFEITYNKKKKQWIIVNPSYTGIYGSVFSRSLSQRWWRRNGRGKIFFLSNKAQHEKIFNSSINFKNWFIGLHKPWTFFRRCSPSQWDIWLRSSFSQIFVIVIYVNITFMKIWIWLQNWFFMFRLIVIVSVIVWKLIGIFAGGKEKEKRKKGETQYLMHHHFHIFFDGTRKTMWWRARCF